MKFSVISLLYFLVVSFGEGAEPLKRGLRAVEGGVSPDGRYVICVLSTKLDEFVDQVDEPYHSPYLVDLETLSVIQRLSSVSALGGLLGRPETNVGAKWFQSSDRVVVWAKTGRLSSKYQLFRLGKDSQLTVEALPDPKKQPDSIFQGLEITNNPGAYVEQISKDGEKMLVKYYGYLPKSDAFYRTTKGAKFDYNSIRVVYELKAGKWAITSMASPGVALKDDM